MSDLILAPLEWSTVQRKVKDLIPYEFNPRKLSEDKKEKLRKSLEKFNLAEIPAINLDNTIIAGHQRVVILLEIGRGEDLIDVRVPNRMLTEEEFKQYNITSNIPTGDWDISMLTDAFGDIDLMELGLDVSKIVLPEDLLPKDLKQEEEEEFDPEPPAEPITSPGDIYEFRSVQKKLVHRILCGDSTQKESYDKLLSGEKFQLITTDPPYNVNYQGGSSAKLKIQNDNMKPDDFYSFLFNFYAETLAASELGASIYVFHADTEGVNFRKAMVDAGFKLSQCLIWLKNSIVMGRQDYHWKHEPCLYGWVEGAAHRWFSDRTQTTVLEFDRPSKSEDHPTMKPLDLFIYLIKNSSKQGDIVGDPFMGSGTTLICCEQSWRNARGLELDPRYVDVQVKRYYQYMKHNHLQFEIYKNGQLMTVEDLEAYAA